MSNAEEIKNRIVQVLKNIYDPEIPISIYDLGLVYSINISEQMIDIELGVTSPLCPMALILPKIVEQELKRNFPGMNIVVRLNLEKQWNPAMMTEEGRKRFKEIFGYDPLERF